MSDLPPEIRELVRRRDAARAAGDFAGADELRDRIHRAGFEVMDTPAGTRALRKAAKPGPGTVRYNSVEAVPSILARPPTVEASVHWLVQGWPEDVLRGMESFRRLRGSHSFQHVVVDLTEDEAWPEGATWPEDADVVPLHPGIGWAGGQNAGMRRSAGRIVVLVDGSVEAAGDVVGPLVDALADPAVGVTGPYGIVTRDLRTFHESPGPAVDAVEAYLMAFRRDLVEGGLRFDEKFKFYRTADIELSFRVKAMGLAATVTPLPVIRHEHRMWVNTPEEERARLSKRNFYRFLDTWRGRTDLLVSPEEGGQGAG